MSYFDNYYIVGFLILAGTLPWVFRYLKSRVHRSAEALRVYREMIRIEGAKRRLGATSGLAEDKRDAAAELLRIRSADRSLHVRTHAQEVLDNMPPGVRAALAEAGVFIPVTKGRVEVLQGCLWSSVLRGAALRELLQIAQMPVGALDTATRSRLFRILADNRGLLTSTELQLVERVTSRGVLSREAVERADAAAWPAYFSLPPGSTQRAPRDAQRVPFAPPPHKVVIPMTQRVPEAMAGFSDAEIQTTLAVLKAGGWSGVEAYEVMGKVLAERKASAKAGSIWEEILK